MVISVVTDKLRKGRSRCENGPEGNERRVRKGAKMELVGKGKRKTGERTHRVSAGRP